MRIKSLVFEDKQLDWKLEKANFGRFNLLVGASGVGKTRVVNTILRLHQIAHKHHGALNGVSFVLEFECNGKSYTWSLNTALVDKHAAVDADDADGAIVLAESIYEDGFGPLVERSSHAFQFKGKDMPLLSASESALNLIGEPEVTALRKAFVNSLMDSSEQSGHREFSRRLLDGIGTYYPDLQTLKEDTNVPVVFKAFALKEKFPSTFEEVKTAFTNIFPSVEDLSVGELSRSGLRLLAQKENIGIGFKIKERGISKWIEAPNISSGMLRTLVTLVNLTLEPEGTVVCIDEFENSLGVNCMGPVGELILERAPSLQFILTSHHPYIINKIPKDYWKLVQRKGNVVRVTPALDIAALDTASSQDGFTQLVNTAEYEEGAT